MDEETAGIFAGQLMVSAIQAATMQALHRKGIFTADEARGIFEAALLDIEQRQGSASQSARANEIAREMMESVLRANPPTPRREPPPPR